METAPLITISQSYSTMLGIFTKPLLYSTPYTGHCLFVQVKLESPSFTHLVPSLMSFLSGVDPEKSGSSSVSEHVLSSHFIF